MRSINKFFIATALLISALVVVTLITKDSDFFRNFVALKTSQLLQRNVTFSDLDIDIDIDSLRHIAVYHNVEAKKTIEIYKNQPTAPGNIAGIISTASTTADPSTTHCTMSSSDNAGFIPPTKEEDFGLNGMDLIIDGWFHERGVMWPGQSMSLKVREIA